MSNENSAPATNDSVPAPSTPAAPEAVTLDITIGNQTVTLEQVETSRRGGGGTILKLIPRLELAATLGFLSNLLVVNGNTPEQADAKINAAIFAHIVRPYAAEATGPSIVTSESGESGFDDTKYIKAFADLFEPSSRQSGPTMAQLLERQNAIAQQMTTEFMVRDASGNSVLKMPEPGTPESFKLAQLTVELGEVNRAISAKQGARAGKPRKPRAKKKAAAAAPVAEAPAAA